MGKAIGEHINNKQIVKNRNTCNASSTSSLSINNNEFHDLILDDMDLTDFNEDQLMTPSMLPVAFNNCTFNNVTININK